MIEIKDNGEFLEPSSYDNINGQIINGNQQTNESGIIFSKASTLNNPTPMLCYDTASGDVLPINNKFPIFSAVRYPDTNPTGIAFCIGKEVVDDGLGNLSWESIWAKLPVTFPIGSPVLGTLNINNPDGSKVVVTPDPANANLVMNLGKNLLAVSVAGNSFLIETLADPLVIKLNNTTEIKPTDINPFININAGTNITLIPDPNPNSNSFTLNAFNSPANVNDPNSVHEIILNAGEPTEETITPASQKISMSTASGGGLVLSGSGSQIDIEIDGLRHVPLKYTAGQPYALNDVVFYGDNLYICNIAGSYQDQIPTAPQFTNLNSSFIKSIRDNSGQLSGETSNRSVQMTSSDVSKLDITASANGLTFVDKTVKTLVDSFDQQVSLISGPSDVNKGCIKFTSNVGQFLSLPDGEFYFQGTGGGGTGGMAGLKDQNNLNTTLSDDFRVQLLPVDTDDLSITVDLAPTVPPSTWKMLFALIKPLKSLGANGSFVEANTNKQINFISSDSTISITADKPNSTLDFTYIPNSSWIRLLSDDSGLPAIPLLPEGEVQLTSNTNINSNDRQISITRDVTNPYRMIFRLLITWVQGVVAGDNNIVTPNPSNRNISILGVDPSVDNVYITTYRDTTNPSILRLKVNGIAPINPAVNNTGAVGSINYTYNNTTRTVTINSGKFNFLQSNGTALQTSITTPISFTNNTVGTSYLWLDNTGSFYNSVTLTDSDFRLFCYIGALYYDNLVPANSFFFFQPDNFQTSALNIDIALGLGPIILNNSGYGIGEGLNGSKVIVNPLIARMNTTGGRLLYPSINSSNSQYFANNKLLVSNGSSPTTIKFYYYSPTSGAFVLFNTGVDLILSQYAPNGVITTIPNNNNAYMNVYFVRDKSLDPALSYWVCVLGSSLASNQFDALQLALQQHNTRPFTLSGLLPQFVSYRSRIVWRKTQTDYTSALYINNNDAFGQASLSTSGSGGGGGDDKVYITKKGVVGDILARTVLSNNNLTIVISEGETYIDGVICPQGIINYTLTPTAETRKYIISSDASGVGHIDQLTSNFDFYTFYLTRAPLVLLWLDSTNRIHNLTGYSNQKVELSTEIVSLFKMDAYKTSCVGTVVQPTSASLVTATITNIKAVHTVFNDIFTPWQQANIDRLLFNSLTNTITEYPLLPSDTLWRASILFVTNCAEKTPVVYSATRYGNDEIDFSRIVIKDGKLHVLNKDKRIVLTNTNPYVFGRNTGYYYEIFLTTQGFDNAGDCKQNLTQLLNQYYGFFFESMALKVCFYQGTTLSDVIDVNLNGRAVGSNRCIVTDDNKSSITF